MPKPNLIRPSVARKFRYFSDRLLEIPDQGFALRGPAAAAVTHPWGNGATARVRINREDWGFKWDLALETGGVVVGDEVAIELEVELVKRKG